MPVTIVRTRDGRLDAEDASEFERLVARLRGSDAPLMVHIHGGLVDEASGLGIARRLSGEGEQAYNAPPATEQLYVVWRTGFLETVSTNWRELHSRDKLYRALLGKLIEFFARRVVGDMSGRGAGGSDLDRSEIERRLSTEGDAPFAELDAPPSEGDARGPMLTMTEEDLEAQLDRELTRNSQVIAAAQDIDAASAAPGERAAISGDPAVGEEILRRMNTRPETEMRAIAANGAVEPAISGRRVGERGVALTVLRGVVGHGVGIGKRVLRRLREGRDHGVHATIVEEIVRELYGDFIGGAVWGLMRQDAADHFAARGMGSAMLDAIAAGPARRVILIGHSAGSIMISRLLLEVARRGMDRQVDVVLLAPAVRGRLFAEAIGAAGDRVERFRMFALSDERERLDSVMGAGTGYLYPSSLLFLVSGLFEEDNQDPIVDAPILGMQRFRAWAGGSLGPEEDGFARTIAAFLEAHPDSQLYAPSSGGADLSCDATSHGGMDNDPETLASVGAMLR